MLKSCQNMTRSQPSIDIGKDVREQRTPSPVWDKALHFAEYSSGRIVPFMQPTRREGRKE